jgi:hypothetical protein
MLTRSSASPSNRLICRVFRLKCSLASGLRLLLSTRIPQYVFWSLIYTREGFKISRTIALTIIYPSTSSSVVSISDCVSSDSDAMSPISAFSANADDRRFCTESRITSRKAVLTIGVNKSLAADVNLPYCMFDTKIRTNSSDGFSIKAFIYCLIAAVYFKRLAVFRIASMLNSDLANFLSSTIVLDCKSESSNRKKGRLSSLLGSSRSVWNRNSLPFVSIANRAEVTVKYLNSCAK